MGDAIDVAPALIPLSHGILIGQVVGGVDVCLGRVRWGERAQRPSGSTVTTAHRWECQVNTTGEDGQLLDTTLRAALRSRAESLGTAHQMFTDEWLTGPLRTQLRDLGFTFHGPFEARAAAEWSTSVTNEPMATLLRRLDLGPAVPQLG